MVNKMSIQDKQHENTGTFKQGSRAVLRDNGNWTKTQMISDIAKKIRWKKIYDRCWATKSLCATGFEQANIKNWLTTA